jgi:hypothetical protein
MGDSGIEYTITAIQSAMYASDTLATPQNAPKTDPYTAFIAYLEGKAINAKFAWCSFDIYSI